MADNKNNPPQWPQFPPPLPENDYYTFNSTPPLPPLVIYTEKTNPWNPLFVRGLLDFTYLPGPNMLSPRMRSPPPPGELLQYPVLYPNLNLPPQIMSLRPRGPIELLRPVPRTLYPIVESPPRHPPEQPDDPAVPQVEIPMPMEEDVDVQAGLKRAREDDGASSSGSKQMRNERDNSA